MSLRKNLFYLFIIIFLVLIIFFIYSSNNFKTSIIGNKNILKEINSLLKPLEARNITEQDFNKLNQLVKNDPYAAGEIKELIILAKYKEYSHIGHSIGFLYEYIKTGEQQICPGHSLSHYYVFMKHGEEDIAIDNLKDAKENFPKWENIEEKHNETYLAEKNYTYFKELFISAIKNIEEGNQTAPDNKISELAEAPCVK